MRYAFESETDEACVAQFRRTLHYKKSYMDGACTDVDYALSIARYLKRHRPAAFERIAQFIPNLVGLQLAYQRLDMLVPSKPSIGIPAFDRIADGLEQAWFAVAQAHHVHKLLGLPAEYRVGNDNRWHQHQTLWPSQPAQQEAAATVVPPAIDTMQIGGGDGRLVGLARAAVDMILHGGAIPAPALGALCSLATADGADELLRALVTEALPPMASRPERGIEDVRAVIGSWFGTTGQTTAVFSPALPFDIVDRDGDPLPLQTEAARLERAGTWRVATPPAPEPKHIRIALNATLAVPGHPDLIQFTGFYAAEGDGEQFRWTGPGPTSTITLPLALTVPGRLIIELDSLGRNAAADDFMIACNGAVLMHALALQEQTARLTADLAPSFLAGPITEIALTVRECTTPALPDRRTLGVVFRSMTLLLGARATAEPTLLPVVADLGALVTTEAPEVVAAATESAMAAGE